MDWKITIELLGIVGGITTFITLFLGPMFYLGSKIDNLRKESKQDLSDFRNEVKQDMNQFRDEMKEFRETWAQETKDFHGRLCAIEERDKK